ncbi:MAG: hydrogen peroxide-dependent heme synthase [Candidatus Binataceae bacterium]
MPPSQSANAAPHTLEGFFVLHQFFRVKLNELSRRSAKEREVMVEKAESALRAMSRREDGETALFGLLGHKGDLMVIHFRHTLDELREAEHAVTHLALSAFLEPTGSYLSVIEIGLYEMTAKLHAELTARGVAPHSPEWSAAVDAALHAQREKLDARLSPPIPARRYVCFYPMNKRRAGADNWYMLPLEERQRLMHEHGMIGRRYAGRVNQIISGSIGFDDWEWGVDLFADDPLVFKQLVYEMRFDESSARYAEFGPFIVAIRRSTDELQRLVFGHTSA